MDIFGIFLKEGFIHILDINAYDHMLYLLVLCVAFSLSDWKKILWLATAFTIGHSVTLSLAVYNIILIPRDVIEMLIPITIIVAGLFNIFKKSQSSNATYILALSIGLIHGLGFSNQLKAISSQEDLLVTLLSFNIGVELGQVVIVLVFLAITYTVTRWIGLDHIHWRKVISAFAILVASYLLYSML